MRVEVSRIELGGVPATPCRVVLPAAPQRHPALPSGAQGLGFLPPARARGHNGQIKLHLIQVELFIPAVHCTGRCNVQRHAVRCFLCSLAATIVMTIGVIPRLLVTVKINGQDHAA